MRHKWTCWAAAAGVMLALTGCESVEEKFVFPGSATQGQPGAVVPPSPDYSLVTLTTPAGTKIQAVYGEAEFADGMIERDHSPRPTVIFFYGNGACAAGMLEVFHRLRFQGANVIMADYPGYGMSGGHPSEAGFYETADAEYNYVSMLPQTDKNRIVACGWSMGAAVAIDLAARRKVVSLATVSAFTSVPAMAHALASWLPATVVLRSRFDNLAKIPSITCPILLAHGTVDNIVPPSMADELAKAATAKVTLLKLPGASHNDVFDAGGEPLWTALHTAIFVEPSRAL